MTAAPTFLPRLSDLAIGAPITREGVSLFPVYLPGGPDELPGVATGPSSPVVITERATATVPTLVAENPSDTMVLLVDGQTLVGGNQNRVLNVSVLVPCRGELEVPVSCVEQGRWQRSDDFVPGTAFATRRVRRAKVATVAHNVAASGSRSSDQGMVWHAVASELHRLDVHHGSDALTAAETRLDAPTARNDADRRIAAAVDELVGRGPLPGQRGVVVAHGARPVSLEWFATSALLAAHWPAIVRSAMLDAPERRPSSRPSAGRALDFVRGAAAHSVTVAAGVGLGREHHLRSSKVVGQALVLDDLVVHASAFAVAA